MKNKGKLLIEPSKANKKSFLENIRQSIRKNATNTREKLILLLNPKIRGWANYFRHIVAKEKFSEVDNEIFKSLWKWCKRRNPEKPKSWTKKKYFRSESMRDWIFSTKIPPEEENPSEHLDLFRASTVKIKRHIKIRAEATPYDPAFEEYFKQRTERKNLRETGSAQQLAL